MSARLPTGIAVSALLRRANDSGGMAMVRARGDADAGGVLVLIGEEGRAVERGVGPDGRPALMESRPPGGGAGGGTRDSAEDYWRRRRARDPDLWVIELNVPDAERLVVETLLVD